MHPSLNRRTFLVTSAALAFSASTAFPAFAAGRKGTFKGDNNHTVTGGVTVRDGKIMLEKNFVFDGAPDPRIALGKSGKYVKNTDFAVLEKDKGAQTYKVPASINVDDYDTVIVWCRKFSVQLAHAKIR